MPSRDSAPMVFVPPGEFTMGSNDGDSDEKPVHTVYLDAFWIDKFEVTNTQYAACLNAGACKSPSQNNSNTRGGYFGNPQFNNYPVIYVSWNDANAYCAWTGERLPTEAEWEKAARGTDGRVYPWGNEWDQTRLNWRDSILRPGDTTADGSYPSGASAYGALDMAGNVWEWVADWYDATYYANSPRNNPKGPASGLNRALRGGAWSTDPSTVRASDRSNYDPDGHIDVIGFRCAQSSQTLTTTQGPSAPTLLPLTSTSTPTRTNTPSPTNTPFPTTVPETFTVDAWREGMQFVAKASGVYRFTISSGAVQVCQPPSDPTSRTCGMWTTYMVLYRNRDISWGTSSGWPCVHPTVPDFSIGSSRAVATYAEAENVGVGNFVEIPLVQDNYVVIAADDCQGTSYRGNQGRLTFSISLVADLPSPTPTATSTRAAIPTRTQTPAPAE